MNILSIIFHNRICYSLHSDSSIMNHAGAGKTVAEFLLQELSDNASLCYNAYKLLTISSFYILKKRKSDK